ncbi:MAG: hypothetical protein U0800_20055 [Isosphaeraceae bacterium]
MITPRNLRIGRWSRALAIASMIIVVLGLLVFPGPRHWSGTRVVQVRVVVGDAEDHHLIHHARVRLFQPGDPYERVVSASTADEGWVKLVNEFWASEGGSGCKDWEHTSYSGWVLEVEAPGYRRFRAPLGREPIPGLGDPSDPPLDLPQPTDHGATATVLLTPR